MWEEDYGNFKLRGRASSGKDRIEEKRSKGLTSWEKSYTC